MCITLCNAVHFCCCPSKVKAATLEKVSQGIIHDTVNLLFNTSSVPFSHDMHQTLKALKQTLAVKVWQYMYRIAKVKTYSIITCIFPEVILHNVF